MRDAFIEGRKIFMRLYSYSLYRISESFRLIVTIAILGLLVGTYPLSPLQLILIALLNDIPIISLAVNRVKVANRPSKLNVRDQFTTSILFGMVGVVESLLLYFFALDYLHLPLMMVQTMFFLKLTVSGHLLIYVAHTKERWWRYLPSGAVIGATALTQIAATLLAVSGALMPSGITWALALLVWLWALVFMQAAEAVKVVRERWV
jgi:H+-transporting ATPase